MIEALKTLGIILATGAVVLAITYPIARVLMPPRRGEDL